MRETLPIARGFISIHGLESISFFGGFPPSGIGWDGRLLGWPHKRIPFKLDTPIACMRNEVDFGI